MSNIQKIIKIGAIILAITIIINIFSLITYGLSFIFDFNLSNKETTTLKETYDNIRSLSIDGISASINITSGTEFKIDAKNITNKIEVNNKDGHLKINEKTKNIFTNNSNGTIYITVPTNTILEKIDIDTGAGKFYIKDIKTKEFDIDHGAGILEIENVQFLESDIDGGAGKIKITNSILNNLELDTGAGKVEITANITGNSQINCGVGEVNITLTEKKDNYQIKTEKGIGSIKIDGITQKNNEIYGNGQNKIEIEGGIGNIEVNFKD